MRGTLTGLMALLLALVAVPAVRPAELAAASRSTTMPPARSSSPPTQTWSSLWATTRTRPARGQPRRRRPRAGLARVPGVLRRQPGQPGMHPPEPALSAGSGLRRLRPAQRLVCAGPQQQLRPGRREHRGCPDPGLRAGLGPACLAGLRPAAPPRGQHSGQKCSIAVWHHERWGTWFFADDPATHEFWLTLNHFHADIVLSGHTH